jgi:hypothetical protein
MGRPSLFFHHVKGFRGTAADLILEGGFGGPWNGRTEYVGPNRQRTPNFNARRYCPVCHKGGEVAGPCCSDLSSGNGVLERSLGIR